MSWFRSWQQRRVLRRLATLDAQIASTEGQLAEMQRIHSMLTTIRGYQIKELSELAGKVAYLRRIRAHNFQHQDTL